MIDEKELYELLEREETKAKPKKPFKHKENSQVLRFIRHHQLAPGDNKVPTYLIYYHYIKWFPRVRTNEAKHWGKEEFFRTFKKHFEQRRNGNQRFYMINDGLDLSDETYEKAKKYDTKWQKRKVHKDKKRKNKVSSLKQGNES